MKILIVEDELAAARRLQELVAEVEPDAEILGVIDSVESTVRWLRNFGCPDLILLDIQLADGTSFEIFPRIDVVCPVMFTTAYDEYLLQAFRVHSVDYLLKPIALSELAQAFEKYHKFYQPDSSPVPGTEVKALLDSLDPTRRYRSRFLVKQGQQLIHIPTSEIGYFYSEDGLTLLVHASGKRYPVDLTIDELDRMLDPAAFFRINRGIIVKADNIAAIHTWFNQRLKLDLQPEHGSEVVVSRDRVRDFKTWLGG